MTKHEKIMHQNFLKRCKKRKEKKELIKTIRFIFVLNIIMISILMSVMFKTRECAVISIRENSIIVLHPNGLKYKYITEEDFSIKEGDTVNVSFNELKDWEKQYTINKIETR